MASAHAFAHLRTKSLAAGRRVTDDLGVWATGTLVRVGVDPYKEWEEGHELRFH